MKKTKADEMDDLITQTEAAKLRGISLPSINELVRRGRLRSKEIFGKKLVYRSEVLAFEKEKPGPKVGEN
jgi:excisionase family DNA binding protein